MTSCFTLRPATLTDSEAMSLLTQPLIEYLVQGDALPEALVESMSPTAFSQRLSKHSGYASTVAELEGRLVGFLTLKGDDYLYHLFVAKYSHRQGIAGLLWRHMIGRSIAEQIRLRSSLYAVPVYRQFGFEPEGPMGTFDSYCFQPMIWRRCCSSVT